MRLYPFPETKTTKVLLAFLMAALLYICRDSMYTTAVLGFNRAYLLTGVLLAISGTAFLICNRKHWKQLLLDVRILFLLCVTAVLLLPMLVKRDWQMMYFSVLLCLWIGIFFSFFWDYRDAAKYFVVIVTVIGVYSILATYVLRILPDKGILSVPVIYNSQNKMFHCFGISIVSDEYVKMRNFGLFREPSIYHCFILLALFLNNYTVRWEKENWLWWVNVLLSLTMVTTFATGGFIELAILAVVVFFDRKFHKRKAAWVIVGLMGIALVIFLAVVIARKGELYWSLYGTFVYKFTPGADSSSDRMGSVLENLRFFLDSPFFGGNIAAVFDTVPNNTSSTTLMLAIFGLLGGVLHVGVWGALVWDKNRAVLSNLALLMILFMAMNTQNLIADVHFWMIPVMAFCQRILPVLRKKA